MEVTHKTNNKLLKTKATKTRRNIVLFLFCMSIFTKVEVSEIQLGGKFGNWFSVGAFCWSLSVFYKEKSVCEKNGEPFSAVDFFIWHGYGFGCTWITEEN